MARTTARLFATGALFSVGLTTGTAWADVIPPPTRPGWDSPPAPLPAPPELALVLALVIAAALITLAIRKRDRSVGAASA